MFEGNKEKSEGGREETCFLSLIGVVCKHEQLNEIFL